MNVVKSVALNRSVFAGNEYEAITHRDRREGEDAQPNILARSFGPEPFLWIGDSAPQQLNREDVAELSMFLTRWLLFGSFGIPQADPPPRMAKAVYTVKDYQPGMEPPPAADDVILLELTPDQPAGAS